MFLSGVASASVACVSLNSEVSLFCVSLQLFDGLTLEELEELQTGVLQYQELVGENG